MEIRNNFCMTEKKSYSPYVMQQISELYNSGSNVLSPTQAYWLHSVSDTVGSACDLISWAFEQIDPVVKEKSTGELINEHPVLELIQNPGFKQTSDQFQFELMSSYLIAGECYPILEGNVKFEPFGLYAIKASDMSLIRGSDGWLQTITGSSEMIRQVFNRVEEKKRGIWVYQADNKLSETVQIVNMIKRNDIRGLSVLERIYYQALMKYHGNIHNYSILSKGVRPSAIIAPKEPLSQDQHEAFIESLQKYEGYSNAGKKFVPNQDINYIDLMVNPKDMDFIKMIENSRVEIYNQYQIPLPLVTTETMTMSNYQKSLNAFYDLAVLPRAKFLYKQLGRFMLPRYKDGDNFEIVINEKEISALKERLFERAILMTKAYIYKDNEMRSETGYESIGTDGDVIYKPLNLAPTDQTDDSALDQIQREENEGSEEDD